MTAIFERVQKSFERQGMMQHLDARLVKVEHGLVELVLPYSDKVTQQQDGFHGGAMGAVADIAGGYAALTVAPEGMEVVTAEYKINFLGGHRGGGLRIGQVGVDPCACGFFERLDRFGGVGQLRHARQELRERRRHLRLGVQRPRQGRRGLGRPRGWRGG